MLRSRLLFIIPLSVLLVGGSIALLAVAKNNDKEEKVPLSSVPAKVLDAANKVVSGGEVKEVEKEVVDGVTIYDVKKVVDGEEYEIEVTADGIVKEVEKEGDDNDKEDEEDDD